MIVNEIIAIVIGYLFGSIPSAYISARLVKGKDIRQMGGGNVGALNTFKEERTSSVATSKGFSNLTYLQ